MDSRRSNDENRRLHISRLKREMDRARYQPFGSPPSSAGSHDTVSTTVGYSSTFSFEPEGESTPRKLDEDILPRHRRAAGRTGRFGHSKPAYTVETSKLDRFFPEWSRNIAVPDNGTNRGRITDALEAKENIPPTIGQKTPESHYHRVPRDRAGMQPTVENESDCSVLSHTPANALSTRRSSRFSRPQVGYSSGSPQGSNKSALGKLSSNIRVAHAKESAADKYMADLASKQRHVETAMTDEPRLMTPPQQSSPLVLRSMHSSNHQIMNMSGMTANQTARSFFMPHFNHLHDLVSGTLRLSTGAHGAPVFVKNGKAHIRPQEPIVEHADVRAIDLPAEEQQIFVSLDKVREEVAALKEHDEMLQKEAEKLEREVDDLQLEIQELRSQKLSDSAIGSDSDQAANERLNTQIQSKNLVTNVYSRMIDSDRNLESRNLQERLDEAYRTIKVHELHNTSLSAERDAALQKLGNAMDASKKLQAELDSLKDEANVIKTYRRERETLQLENKSLLSNNNSLREQHEFLATENVALRQEQESIASENMALRQEQVSLLSETRTLRATNKTLTTQHDSLRQSHITTQQELEDARKEIIDLRDELASIRTEHQTLMEQHAMVSQDHGGLERSNEHYFLENKNLKSKISLLEQRNQALQQSIATRDQVIELLQNDPTRATNMTEQSLPEQVRPAAPEDTAELPQNDPTQQTEAMEEEPPQEDDADNDSADENMTSAFFIPDITMETEKETTGNPTVASTNDARRVVFAEDTIESQKTERNGTRNMGPSLSQPARRVFHDLCKHKSKNCSVCARLSTETKHVTSTITSKTTTQSNLKTAMKSGHSIRESRKTVGIVPRPIPVTDRIPQPTGEYEDEPTMRPAKSPGHALAIVIKGLEDEIQHLQAAAMSAQARYNSLDKSAGRRDRKELAGEIVALQHQLEIKSDQVYRLYDVLEGQKMSGQAMTEDEIEATIVTIVSV